MKLLIVDDSALMRRVLQDCFASVPEVETIFARNGVDALQVIAQQNPDVVTLDINMPVMDGLTCLAHIMEEHPRPVIMVSSLTEKGALSTFEALELGAVDFVAKPGGTVSMNMDLVFQDLRDKVAAAYGTARKPAPESAPLSGPVSAPVSAPPHASNGPVQPAVAQPRRGGRTPAELVLIGCSTGGPKVLGPLLQALPGDCPAPIVIAQHMPERFTGIFARRLAEECAIHVEEVVRPTKLESGTAYIASGGRDILLARSCGFLSARPVAADERFTWHPSVSRMVASAMDHVAPDAMIAVMLTGMGDDGATEMAQLRAAGGRTIAESEETAAIFGMPQKLIEKGGASVVLPSDRIAPQLRSWLAPASASPNPRRSQSCR